MNEPRSRAPRYRSFRREIDCIRVHTLSRKNEESAKQSFEVWTRVRINIWGKFPQPLSVKGFSTCPGGFLSLSRRIFQSVQEDFSVCPGGFLSLSKRVSQPVQEGFSDCLGGILSLSRRVSQIYTPTPLSGVLVPVHCSIAPQTYKSPSRRRPPGRRPRGGGRGGAAGGGNGEGIGHSMHRGHCLNGHSTCPEVCGHKNSYVHMARETRFTDEISAKSPSMSLCCSIAPRGPQWALDEEPSPSTLVDDG